MTMETSILGLVRSFPMETRQPSGGMNCPQRGESCFGGLLKHTNQCAVFSAHGNKCVQATLTYAVHFCCVPHTRCPSNGKHMLRLKKVNWCSVDGVQQIR